ncbi:peroxidase family protein [Miltoncostaea marina]|uniref:peroxidase family protein n=1 Tax=Miltoncostaea marina TaxID=2843215 RepID=UPI001C3DC817|nr:heme peroxidase family protein [Miltoncostaea marina]
MSTTEQPGSQTEQIHAPRTTEQLIARATAPRDMGDTRRSARGHGYEMRGLSYVPESRLHEGRFGRMFRLPPFIPTDEQISAIEEVMQEPAQFDPSLDNGEIPAGYTYLGQFIDHDLTFDTASSLERQNDPDALTNFRSPRFDLDSVYGRGPVDDPFLYDKGSGGAALLIGSNGREDDLPRNAQDTALIGDPRNDENIFVSQLQLTMLKFHNAVLAMVRGDASVKRGSETDFEAAQRIVRWHYQWIVVHDFLRRTVGQAMLDDVLDRSGPVPTVRRRFYDWRNGPFMPVEFSVAAYRFGHSQIRGRYQLNTLVGPLPTFKAGPVGVDPLGHFGGFRRLPAFWTIEWPRFFDVPFEGPEPPEFDVQRTRLIDTRLAGPLRTLPDEIGGNVPSLALRNLTRGARLLLPSGQDVAYRMGVRPVSESDLGLPAGGPAPLWYYILREAEVQAGGRHLGEVGGRIVAEVFLGLLEADPSSYLRNQPDWTPFLRSETPGDFAMPDLLRFAGHGLGVTNVPNGGGAEAPAGRPAAPAPPPGG